MKDHFLPKAEAEFRKSRRLFRVLLVLLVPITLVACILGVVLRLAFVFGIIEAGFLITFGLTCRWSFEAYGRWAGDSLHREEKEHSARKHPQRDLRATALTKVEALSSNPKGEKPALSPPIPIPTIRATLDHAPMSVSGH